MVQEPLFLLGILQDQYYNMATTPFQTQSHSLHVGASITPIYLPNFCAPATKFQVVNTSAAWNAGSLLPPGLSMNSSGVISGTPTQSGVWIVKVRAFRGNRNPDASWTARSAGAYNSQRFDSAAPITIARSDQTPNTSWDGTVFRSGVGSMLQYLPANDSLNDSCKWFFSTKVNQQYVPGTPGFASNTGFNLGETFYVQFSLRPDLNFVKWPWPTTPKIYILDMLPWTTNLNLGPTANPWEVVMIQRYGYFWGYQNGPSGGQPGPNNAADNENWSAAVGGGGEIVFQPAFQNTTRVLNGDNPGLPSGAGPAWTANQQMRARYGHLYQIYENIGNPDGLTDPISDGVPFDILQWHTILLKVTVDTAFGAGNGHITVMVAPDGQDYKTIIDHQYVTNITNPTSPLFVRDSNQPNGGQDTVFSSMGFINLAFGSDLSNKPYTSYNIDEIISSPNFIPAPDVGDGTSNYRTSDIILTFKVS